MGPTGSGKTTLVALQIDFVVLFSPLEYDHDNFSYTFPAHTHTHRLLDILAGRKAKANVGGYVLVNGRPQPSNFRCKSGYVVQVSPSPFPPSSEISINIIDSLWL